MRKRRRFAGSSVALTLDFVALSVWRSATRFSDDVTFFRGDDAGALGAVGASRSAASA